ncbi:hypothetical protein [uncultured Methanolobus sp.]|uniref:hypothetical protein n=1 Tax=uncultured Methanolobus sp. TaxID=218300 RepID=UPI002AAC10AD|nr:hypothetical protein [uncultured Methanolobus sp.]
MKTLTRSIVAILAVFLVASLIGTAAAEPTATRSLSTDTVSAGDTITVTLIMDLDRDASAPTLSEVYDPATDMGAWNVTAVTIPSELDLGLITTASTGEYNFGRSPMSSDLSSGTSLEVVYELTIDSATPTGTYDLEGYYYDVTGSGTTIPMTGDTQITVTAPVDNLYDGVIDLEDGATAQDALNATCLEYSLQSAGLHVFLNMEGYNVSSASSSYWTLWINNEDCGYNMANNFSTITLSDDDVVEFLYTTNGTTIAKVTVETNMLDSITAVRNIPYETVYYGSSDSDKKVLVEVDITVNEELSSLTLSEILDPAFDESDVEAVELDGGSLNLGADNATFEILWSGNFVEGDTKHVEYTIFVDEAAGDYTFGDSFVDAYHMDDYLVTGEDTIRVTGDWNPWNDEDSDDGRYITTAEFQAAVYCWVKDVLAPTTGADIDTSRMQAIAHFYANGFEMGDNEE